MTEPLQVVTAEMYRERALKESVDSMGILGSKKEVSAAVKAADESGLDPLTMLDPKLRDYYTREAAKQNIPIERLAKARTGNWAQSNPFNFDVVGADGWDPLLSVESNLIRAERARVDADNDKSGRGVITGLTASLASGGVKLATTGPDLQNVVASAVLNTDEAAKFRKLQLDYTPGYSAMKGADKWLESKKRATENVLLTDPRTGEQIINWGAVNPLTGHGIENIANMVAGEAIPMLAQYLIAVAAAPVTGGQSLTAVTAANAGKLSKIGAFGKAVFAYAKSPVSIVNASRVVTGNADQGVKEFMQKGMTEDEAWEKVAPGALLSGLFSAAAGSPLEAKIMEDLFTKTATTKLGATFMNRAAARAKSFLEQGAKEGLQEVAEGLGEDLAAQITYSPDKTMKEWASNAIMNFVGGAAMGGVTGSVVHGSRSIHAAEAATFIASLGDPKLREVLGESGKLPEFVRHITQEGDFKQLHIDANTVVNLFQGEHGGSMSLDEIKSMVTQKLGVAPADYDMALKNGTDFVVDTGLYAKFVQDNPESFSAMYEATRTHQGGGTLGELAQTHANEQYSAEMRKAMDALPASPERDSTAQKIALMLQASTRVFSEKESMLIAHDYAKVLDVMAQRGKVGINDLFEKNKLNIVKDVHAKMDQLEKDHALKAQAAPSGTSLGQASASVSFTPTQGIISGLLPGEGGVHGAGSQGPEAALAGRAGQAGSSRRLGQGLAPQSRTHLFHGTTRALDGTVPNPEVRGRAKPGGMGPGIHSSDGTSAMGIYSGGNQDGMWRIGLGENYTPFDATTEKTYSPGEAAQLGVITSEALTGYDIWMHLQAELGPDGAAAHLRAQGFDGLHYHYAGADEAWSVWSQDAMAGARPTDMHTAEAALADYRSQVPARRDALTGNLRENLRTNQDPIQLINDASSLVAPGAENGLMLDPSGEIVFNVENAAAGLANTEAIVTLNQGVSTPHAQRVFDVGGEIQMHGRILRGTNKTTGQAHEVVYSHILSSSFEPMPFDVMKGAEGRAAVLAAAKSMADNIVWLKPTVIDRLQKLRYSKDADGMYGNDKMSFGNMAYPHGRNTWDLQGCGREAWAVSNGQDLKAACYGGACYAEALKIGKQGKSAGITKGFDKISAKGELRAQLIATLTKDGFDAAQMEGRKLHVEVVKLPISPKQAGEQAGPTVWKENGKFFKATFGQYKRGGVVVSLKEVETGAGVPAIVTTSLEGAKGQDVRIGVDTDGAAWLSDTKVLDALLAAAPRSLSIYSSAYHMPPPAHPLSGRTIINVTVSGWHPIGETLSRLKWAEQARANGWNVILREVLADPSIFGQDTADVYNRLHDALLKTDFFIMQQPLHVGRKMGEELFGLPGCCKGSEQNPHKCDQCEVAEGLGTRFQDYWGIKEEPNREERILPDVPDYKGVQLDAVPMGEVTLNQPAGVHINDSTQAFTEQILNGEKTIETRNNRKLDALVGQTVGIVRTGVGGATLVGKVTFGEPIIYTTMAAFRADQDKHLIQPGDKKFDFNGRVKYGYRITSVERVDPEVVGPITPGNYTYREVTLNQSVNQTQTPAFQNWFGDSKVVDAEGKPLVVYHGTKDATFDRFRPETDRYGYDNDQLGSHFTVDPSVASLFAETGGGRANNNGVYPVFLSIQNPLRLPDTGGAWDAGRIHTAIERLGDTATPAQQKLYDRLEDMVFGDEEPTRDGVVAILRELGYDGVVYLNRRELVRDGATGISASDWADVLLRKSDNLSDDAFRSAYPHAKDAYIVFDSGQVKSSTGNNGEFSGTTILNQLPTQSPLGFYSQLEAKLPLMSAATDKNGMIQPKQAISWITSNASKLRIQKAELDYSGVVPFLESLSGKVHIDTIIEFVRKGGLEIKEKVRTETGTLPLDFDTRLEEMQDRERIAYDERTRLRTIYQNALSQAELEFTSRHGYAAPDVRELQQLYADAVGNRDLLSELIDSPEWMAVSDEYKILEKWQEASDAHEGYMVIRKEIDAFHDKWDSAKYTTKFKNWAVPGGTEYKEIELLMPFDTSAVRRKIDELKAEQKASNRRATANDLEMHGMGLAFERSEAKMADYEATLRMDDITGGVRKGLEDLLAREKVRYQGLVDKQEALRENMEYYDRENDRLRSEILAAQVGLSELPVFMEPHFNDENVVGHFRCDERIIDGKVVLFLQEVQSEWGEQGEKRGFKGDKDKDVELSQKLHLELTRLGDADTPERRRIEKTLYRLDRRIDSDLYNIPQSPFVADTKAWAELILKRVVRYAAENGYDSIALANGDQNAEHYKLSKQVSRIDWEPDGNNTYGIETFDVNGNKINKASGSMPLGQIEATFGRGIADKIVADEKAKENILEEVLSRPGKISELVPIAIEATSMYGSIQGENLDVGAGGMRYFYDTLIPSMLNKILKGAGNSTGMQPVKVAVPSNNVGPAQVEGLAALDRAGAFEQMNPQYADRLGSLRGVPFVAFDSKDDPRWEAPVLNTVEATIDGEPGLVEIVLDKRGINLFRNEIGHDTEFIGTLPYLTTNGTEYAPLDSEYAEEFLRKQIRGVSEACRFTESVANAVRSGDLSRTVILGSAPGQVAMHDNLIIHFDPEVRNTIADTGFALWQPDMGGEKPQPRGSISWPAPYGITSPTSNGEPRVLNMKLFEQENRSTVLHELGHFYLELLADIAEMPAADQSVKDDFAKVLKWFGVTERSQITAEMHERFADGHLVYLMEGKAPSEELQRPFQKYTGWLTKLAQKLLEKGESMLGVQVNMSDEVRGVFDRLYASEREIENAKKSLTFQMFTTAEQARMSQAEFKVYSQAVKDEVDGAKEKMTQRLMRQLDNQQKREYKKQLQQISDRIRKELDATPEYTAATALQRGMMDDGETVVGKLDRGLLIDMYGQDIVARLPKGITANTDGTISPDEAAILLNLFDTNGDTLIQQLTDLPEYEKTIKDRAQAEMDQTHPNAIKDEAQLQEMAIEILQGEGRERVLSTELQSLRRAQREAAAAVKIVTDEAKAAAQHRKTLEQKLQRIQAENTQAANQARRELKAELSRIEKQERAEKEQVRKEASVFQKLKEYRAEARRYVENTPIWKLNSGKHLNDQRMFSMQSYEASLKDEYTKAAQLKEQEILSHYLYIESKNAEDRADNFRAYVKRTDSGTVRANMAMAGNGLLAQFDKLRDRFTIDRAPNKELVRRQDLKTFVESMAEQQVEIAIEDWILDETQPVRNYRELTVRQMDGLHNAMKSIRHAAKLELSALIDGKRVYYDQIHTELSEAAEENLSYKPVYDDGSPKADEKLVKLRAQLMGLDSTMTKILQLVNWIDGNKVNGPAHRYIWNPMVQSQALDHKLTLMFNKVITDALEKMPSSYKGTWKETFDLGVIGEDGKPRLFYKREIIGMLLYNGQETRLQKLLAGRLNKGLDKATMEKAFTHLTKNDLLVAEKVWETFDKIKPLVLDLEERLSGVRPEWEESRSFDVLGPDGSVTGHMKGGYFPLVADRSSGRQVAKKQEGGTVQEALSSNGYSRARTSISHTKDITGKVYPLLLDFERIVTSELTNQIKDIAYRENVLMLNRIFTSDRFNDVMVRRLGQKYTRQFEPWLINIVSDRNTGATRGMEEFEGVAGKMKSNAASAMICWKLMSVLVQPADLVRTLAPGPHGIKKLRLAEAWLELNPANPNRRATIDKIKQLSPQMAMREENLDRDLRANMQRLTGDESIMAATERIGYAGFTAMDALISWPTWLAKYNEKVAEHGDEIRAAAEADDTVGLLLQAGAPKDLAPIQANKNKFAQLFTMFMGDAVNNYGLLRNAGHNINGLKGIPTFTGLVVYLMLQAIIGDLLKGNWPDDDEDAAKWAAIKAATAPLNVIPFGRDVGNMAENILRDKPLMSMRMSPGFESVAKVPMVMVYHPMRLARGDEEFADFVINELEGTGFIFGVPGTAQAAASTKYFKRYMDGEERPANPAQFAWDLARGKKKEKN